MTSRIIVSSISFVVFQDDDMTEEMLLQASTNSLSSRQPKNVPKRLTVVNVSTVLFVTIRQLS